MLAYCSAWAFGASAYPYPLIASLTRIYILQLPRYMIARQQDYPSLTHMGFFYRTGRRHYCASGLQACVVCLDNSVLNRCDYRCCTVLFRCEGCQLEAGHFHLLLSYYTAKCGVDLRFVGGNGIEHTSLLRTCSTSCYDCRIMWKTVLLVL